jgi:DNA-binding ferritin-like protein
MSFFTDVVDTRAFQTAEQDTLQSINKVMGSVDHLVQAVHGLDVKGQFAEQWHAATSAFDTTTQECKKGCDRLAEAVRVHGQNTDRANQSAADAYQNLASAAHRGGLV